VRVLYYTKTGEIHLAVEVTLAVCGVM